MIIFSKFDKAVLPMVSPKTCMRSKSRKPRVPSQSFEAQVEPSVLVWARESAGRTIDKVALKLDVDEHLIKNWESGNEKPTFNQLRILSYYYKRPISAFLLSEPPKEPLLHDFRELPGEKKVSLQPKTRFAMRRARRLQSLAVELKGEIHNDKFNKILDMNDVDPESFANNVRNALGIDILKQSEWKKDIDALNKWVKTIEALDILVLQLSMPIEDARAFSFTDGGIPVIAINTQDAINARIFSLFHELGHVLLNKGGVCDLSIDWENIHGGSIPVKDLEVFCNHFAGAILVPKKDLLNHALVIGKTKQDQWSNRSLGTLANDFKVSREVVLRRLLIFDIVSEEFYKDKRAEWRNKPSKKPGGGGQDIAKLCIQRNGSPFVSLILESFRNKNITKSDVADYLDINLKHLPNVERALGS